MHDTIARVINLISAKQLQRCFTAWMKDCHEVTEGEVVAIDGKTLRGTYNKDKRCGAIHMVSAFSAANQVVLGLVKTADKSNEIKRSLNSLRWTGMARAKNNGYRCFFTIKERGR